MTLLAILASLLVLILLIAVVKLHSFLAFIITSVLAGLLLHMPPATIATSIQKGMGSILGDLLILICLGAMLGNFVAQTGAARKIADVIIKLFGKQRLQISLMITGFIVGIPLFYNVGFIVLIPVVFALVYSTNINAVYAALPMLAALSVTHGFLPPHPSPMAISAQLQASTGRVLWYGFLAAVPAVLLAGLLFSRIFKNKIMGNLLLFTPSKNAEEQKQVSAFAAISAALSPAVLLIGFALLQAAYPQTLGKNSWFIFFANPAIVMLVSLLYAMLVLGAGKRFTMLKTGSIFNAGIQDVALILLIIAGAGGLKQVMTDSGASGIIGAYFYGLHINPLLLGWLIAGAIRVAVGSATVAGLTAAGLVAPMAAQLNFDPALMVISIGAGSLLFSHVNDSGFWMFKEYFGLSIRQTIMSWSVMETIVSVTGLVVVLLLQWLV